MDSPPGILTLNDVAKRLRCSKTHVANLVNGRLRGVPPIPSVKLGRRTLVRDTTLSSWIAALEKTEGGTLPEAPDGGAGERS